MSQEVREGMRETLERFQAGQEQLEKLAYDALNLSDSIRNMVKGTLSCLEEEDKEKAILSAKDCLTSILAYIDELSNAIHNGESSFVIQTESLEAIQQAVDFLCCDWDDA